LVTGATNELSLPPPTEQFEVPKRMLPQHFKKSVNFNN
jgi:hypothetical protein